MRLDGCSRHRAGKANPTLQRLSKRFRMFAAMDHHEGAAFQAGDVGGALSPDTARATP